MFLVMENVTIIKNGKISMIRSDKKNVRNGRINSEIIEWEIEPVTKEYKYCLRCGKKLKNPLARKIGYGPICEKKVAVMMKRRLF